MGKRRLGLILTGILLLGVTGASGQEAGPTIVKRGAVGEDLYAAGATVDVLAEVDGDVVVAGGRVLVGRQIKGDVMVAGGLVQVNGEVKDDVRAVGGMVSLGANIDGDAVAAGGRVSLGPEARVGARAWLAGGAVEVRGRIGRGLKVTAGSARISGEVTGDVEIVAGEIQILPSAKIHGNLTYWSPRQARIDPEAAVSGSIIHHRPEWPERAARAGRVFLGFVKIMGFLGLIATGIVLLLLFPDFTSSAARTISSDPWKSLGLGFALLVAAPVGALLLMITVAGVPLGLVIVALYLVSLLLGYLTGVFFLGETALRWIRRRAELSKGTRILGFAVALLVLGLIRLVPVLGTVVSFLTLLFGLGAWSLRVHRAYAGRAG